MRRPSSQSHVIRSSNASTIPSVAICVETGTSWGRRVVTGILQYAKEHGPWHIFVEPHGPGEPLQLPASWHGSGVIARVADREAAQTLDALGVPVVNISSIRIDGTDYPRIMTAAEPCARLAADFLRERGFQHFAYVGDSSEGYVQCLYEAFSAVLKSRGRSCRLISPDLKRDALGRQLASLPKPAGVLCWGPTIGRSVIEACLEAGINVPHEIAVLGADYDEILSEASYPPQSGLRIASEQIGMKAAAVLDRLMHGAELDQREWSIAPQGIVEKLSTDTLAVADRRLAAVMRYIINHSDEEITVDQILHENPMARRSLERKFRKYFGCSIIEQIRQIRVRKARLLLAVTDDPVTLVAERCGFSSYNYLGRTFKSVTGMSPLAYRAQCRAHRI